MQHAHGNLDTAWPAGAGPLRSCVPGNSCSHSAARPVPVRPPGPVGHEKWFLRILFMINLSSALSLGSS